MSVNNLLNAWNDKNMGIDCYTYNLIFLFEMDIIVNNYNS